MSSACQCHIEGAYCFYCEVYRPVVSENEQLREQVKQLKEDNARLTCKYTGAEQKYLTQSNVIAELRKQLKVAELAYEGLEKDCVTRGEYDSLIDKHTVLAKAFRTEKERAMKNDRQLALAEEREQKLAEAIGEAMSWTWNCGENNMSEVKAVLDKVISDIYPLDREDTE